VTPDRRAVVQLAARWLLAGLALILVACNNSSGGSSY
jgi:hypothetical protein